MIVLVVFCAVLSLWLIPALYDTFRSEAIWQQLQSALKSGDMATVRRLLTDTDRDLHDIVGNKIIYFFKHDYTDRLANMPVRFWATLEYYLTDPGSRRHDKVILPEGYAFIDSGRVTFMKFY